MEYENPETRLAARLVERFALKPPVDILGLARRYARLRLVEFPVDVDGVSVGLKQAGRKPAIYVNSAMPARRVRFTIAHELGHVLIPWHVGSIVDELEIDESEEHSRYWQMEKEANRFAADLLMPPAWARKILRQATQISHAVDQIAEAADVSVDAAILRALRLGPPGYVLVRSTGGEVVWSSKTPGTAANRPPVGMRVTRKLIEPSLSYGVNHSYGGIYHWWKEADLVRIPHNSGEDWRSILSEIMGDLDLSQPHRARQSINAIIGYAKGRLHEGRTRDRVYATCLQVTRNRNDPNLDVGKIIAHPRFHDYVVAKVHSLEL